MKRIFSLLLLSGAMAVAQSSLLSEAQQDFAAGRLDEAKLKFEVVLNRDPKNVTARNYLRMIEAARRKLGPGVGREAAFRGIMIPKVQFNGAQLSECLEFLHQQVEELSGGQLAPNFVVSPAVNRAAPVTLNLSNIPFTELLRYIGRLTDTEFVYQAHAISVVPAGGGGNPAAVKTTSSAKIISE